MGLELEGPVCQTQEFGFYLQHNADSLQDCMQACEKSGACFRNPIFLMLCICHDKGPGGGPERKKL